ncbi:hypothetical protein K7X08_004337 [Anisodus acutangulus]|uniref:Uncharacterized protein n=1 Tax=Anisodus acutangulus TaxID=402998 RepID=A0A9Q1RK18_9SOLA|nr:hypothetical protein K7X08_004337 [Anisodus acutangulus]
MIPFILSSSLAHAPMHSQDPSSASLKATVSPAKTAEASYAGAVVESTGDNPSVEAHPTDDSEVVWELDQKAGSERLAKLENGWSTWKSRLVQAMPISTTLLPADHVVELSADTLMDLQSEAITISVVQEVSADTQAFTEATSTVVAKPLLGAEREVQVGAGAAEVVSVVVAEREREIAGTQDAQVVVDSANPKTSITGDIFQPLAGGMPTNSAP